MPSSQVQALGTLEALARPANTIATNLPKQASGRAQKVSRPSVLKATTARGKAKSQNKTDKSTMTSVLSGC